MGGATLPLLGSITAAANGTGSFTFPSPPQGEVWTGTLAVTGAASGAVWTISIGSFGAFNQVTNGQGSNSMGPVQCWPAQEVQLSGSNLVAGQVYPIVWMILTENPATAGGVYPAPTAIAAAPVNLCDSLLSNASLGPPTVGSGDTTSFIAPNNYSMFSVWMHVAGTIYSVIVFNITKGINSGEQSFIVPPSGFLSTLFFPVPCTAGDTIEIQVILVAGSSGPNTVALFCDGLSLAAMPYPLRFDGRTYPIGMFSAHVAFTGNTTLIAAPGNNIGIMLKSLSLLGGVSNAWGSCAIKATLNGTASELLPGVVSDAVTPTVTTLVSDTGILCDANTAVTVTSSAILTNAGDAVAVYDLVAL